MVGAGQLPTAVEPGNDRVRLRRQVAEGLPEAGIVVNYAGVLIGMVGKGTPYFLESLIHGQQLPGTPRIYLI